MQTSEMDRKREAFLEHLKQKYPHHATAIMGHQERLRDQVRMCYHFALQSSFFNEHEGKQSDLWFKREKIIEWTVPTTKLLQISRKEIQRVGISPKRVPMVTHKCI